MALCAGMVLALVSGDRSVAARVAFPSVAFVVECAPSHQAADDPIVHPGHGGTSHQHQFFGNRSTSAASTVETLKRSTTTCSDHDDLAAYWVPTPVGARWIGMRAYYDAGLVDPATISAPTLGLKMLAGEVRSKSPQGLATVAWSCGRSVDATGWSRNAMGCRNGRDLRVRVTFAQCWSGKTRADGTADLVPAHVSECPVTHSIALPRLRLLLDLSGALTSFSSGDVNGMHADFWNGWNTVRLQRLIDVCIKGQRLTNRDQAQCRPSGGEPESQ